MLTQRQKIRAAKSTIEPPKSTARADRPIMVAPINRLPPEILLYIFTFLRQRDFLATARVSHLWHDFVNDSSLDGIFQNALLGRQQTRLDILTRLTANNARLTAPLQTLLVVPRSREQQRQFELASTEIVDTVQNATIFARVGRLRYMSTRELIMRAPAPTRLMLFSAICLLASGLITACETFLPNVACELMAGRMMQHRYSNDAIISFYNKCLTNTDLTILERFRKSYSAQMLLTAPALILSVILFTIAILKILITNEVTLVALTAKLTSLVNIRNRPANNLQETSVINKLKNLVTFPQDASLANKVLHVLTVVSAIAAIGCLLVVLGRTLMPTLTCNLLAHGFMGRRDAIDDKSVIEKFLTQCLANGELPILQRVATNYSEQSPFIDIAILSSLLLFTITAIKYVNANRFQTRNNPALGAQDLHRDDVEANILRVG